MAKKPKYIKSDAFAHEIDEEDFIEIGGCKFKVIGTSTHSLGQVILSLEAAEIQEIVNYSTTLIVPQHYLFQIFNQIPKKK